MDEIYLNPAQVRRMIKKAEKAEEVIVIRCRRKTPASKPGGPDVGELYDLHCTTKPSYEGAGVDRKKEDRRRGVLTVYVVNRKDPDTDTWGSWRRVNIKEVVKVIYKTREWEVKHT